jgi:hypothetical protein
MTDDLFQWAEKQTAAAPIRERDLWCSQDGYRWRMLKSDYGKPNWQRERWGPAVAWTPPGTWTRIGGPNVADLRLARMEQARRVEAKQRFLAWYCGDLDRPA